MRRSHVSTEKSKGGKRVPEMHQTKKRNQYYFGMKAHIGEDIDSGQVYSVVGAGVVLHEDLPDRQLVTVRQELERRPWGPEQYGW